MVSSIDIVPTMLGAVGADIPSDLPGLDLTASLQEGKEIKRNAIFGESFAHDVADVEDPEASLVYRWCISGHWKLLLTYDGATGRYGNVLRRGELGPQLFDLEADPFETKNLASDNPDVVTQLAKKIDRWWPVKKRKVFGLAASGSR